ncbi:protein O-GlcNAcase [Paenibacillus lignilyticus]|uniref:Beta-N-acetylglucosaminidase domain-containing protein n=1 Tax=Paenibacillus lignilyticus TaxID=1172615 RepID=A0ABS5C992_9BACL|nr:protein O-GlcNAcase [Paenibacillus lignilyticus]MBP3962557.1 beta-N-acetylglucosaminidase domain-containing protein [Paenibacillus lignilyticus]
MTTFPSISSLGENSSVIQNWCERNNYSYLGDQGGEIQITASYSTEARFTYLEELGSISDEIYQLELSGELPRCKVNIICSGERALRYALNAVSFKIKRGEWREGVEFDYPRFPIRGIIEGFYGQPWNQEQRLSMLSFIASNNMNTYVYGPKDDVYHRERWQDLYDEESYTKLGDVFSESTALGLDFYYCIAPGLSMRYSSEEQFEALVRKVRQIYELGVKKFCLLLDDIPEELQHQEDIRIYSDLVEAHIRLVNRFYTEIMNWDAGIRLVVCPTQYWGNGNERYISLLGSSIHPSIDLFWTGRNICSPEITLSEAAVFTQNTYRKPLYWDNYPVNDVEMTDEMHIGPYRQRDRHLYRFSRGVIANGMEYAESSKISYATIASYLWNPEQYDPEASWRDALKEVVGQSDFEHMLQFADNVRYSCLYLTDSPMLAAELTRFNFSYFYGDRKQAIDDLERFVLKMNESAAVLLSGGMENQALQKELKRWILKFSVGIAVLQDCMNYIRSQSMDDLMVVRHNYELYRSDLTYVFSDVLSSFLNKVLEEYYSAK